MTAIGANISAQAYGNDRRTAGYMPVFNEKIAKSLNTPEALNALEPASGPADSAEATEDGGFLSFVKGVIDVINPLQHLPVVSAIYRHVTGDEISPMARVAGDTIFGGPVGGLLGFADAALEHATGKDMGATVFAMLDGDTPAQDEGVQYAQQSSHAATSGEEVAWNGPAATIPAQPPVPASKGQAFRMDAPTPLLTQDAPAEVTPPPSGPFAKPEADVGMPLVMNDTPKEKHKYFETSPQPNKAMVAAQMMDALDKYGVMKKAGLAPAPHAVSGAY